ncbi:response regulator [Algoriphagus jejuensis]|uniref:Response regulator n=1 Tax=Algoriphagus jejuensis TaxID=419934 RepID=A0ABN1N1Z1_9BACT
MANFHFREVILVDDDLIVRMVATKILKSIDFNGTISAFENGALAIEEIRRRFSSEKIDSNGPPILLLLDINMPVLDAWGFLDQFSTLDQEFKKNFYISIITSSIDTNDRIKAFSCSDVVDYISKPLSAKHLTDFLSKHSLIEV